MARVYVQQFGYFWSLTMSEWQGVIRDYFSSEDGYDLGRYKSIQKPKVVFSDREGDFYKIGNDVILVQPLDWTDEEWVEEAILREVEVPDDLKHFIRK